MNELIMKMATKSKLCKVLIGCEWPTFLKKRKINKAKCGP